MNHILLIILISVCITAGVIYCAARQRKGHSYNVTNAPIEERRDPDNECFDMRVEEAVGKIIVSGRLAVFVPPGSQYSIWRQFPRSIRFHLIEYPGGMDKELPDHTLSISDTKEVYANYSHMPCDRIVEKDFTMDLMKIYPEIFTVPGQYIISGEYAGLKTAKVSFILEE